MLLRSGWIYDSSLGSMSEKNPVGTYLKQNRKGWEWKVLKNVWHISNLSMMKFLQIKAKKIYVQSRNNTIMKNKNKEKKWEKKLRFYMSMD